MLICVINPNTTSSMTMKIGAAAKIAASPGVEISAVNPSFGPTSIEGYFDEVFSVPGLIEEIGKAAGADAVVIACFDDTGLDAARCATTAPVIGIGEAAFHMASLIAAKFSVVTTLSRSIAPIEHNLVRYGLAARARVCAPAMCPCSRSRSRAPMRGVGSKRRSSVRSQRTAPRRSCSGAPA
jgi:allantoin racemase